MTSNTTGERRSGEGLNRMTSNMKDQDKVQTADQTYEKSGGLNCMTSDMLGEERSTRGKALVFPVLPVARYLGLSSLMTFHTWPIVLLCSCLSDNLPYLCHCSHTSLHMKQSLPSLSLVGISSSLLRVNVQYVTIS